MAEQVKKRRRGHTRISSKHQVTIPAEAMRQAGLKAGDELRVEVDDGRVVLEPALSLAERRRAALRETAGIFTGMYEPGYLDKLRDEWR